MTSPLPINLIILSGIIGFALYCLSHALRVWQVRNRATRKRSTRAAPGAGYARGIWLAGLAICIVAIVGTSLVKHEGELIGDGLTAPRLGEQMEVVQRAPQGPVAAGAMLVRFHDPQREAEIASLKLRQRILSDQREADATKAAELSPDLARRQQDLDGEQHHLQAMLDQMLPDRDQIVRDQINGRATAMELRNQLEGQGAEAEAQLSSAKAKLALGQQRAKRLALLAKNNAASAEERDDNEVELQVLTADVKKLQARLQSVDSRRKQIQQDSDELLGTTQRQAGEMTTQIQSLQDRLATAQKAEDSLDKLIDADRADAEKRKQAALSSSDLELQQASAKQQGLERMLTITAPSAGVVRYSAPAPGTIARDEPVLVFAPAGSDAFLVRLRLSIPQARALARAGQVMLESPTSSIEQRFEGSLQRWTPLPNNPGMALAELSCDPPANIVADLIGKGKLDVTLRWVPPFYTIPTFLAGAALMVIGLLAQLLLARRRPAGAAMEQPGVAPPRAAAVPRAVPAMASHPGSVAIPRTGPVAAAHAGPDLASTAKANGNGRHDENPRHLQPILVPQRR